MRHYAIGVDLGGTNLRAAAIDRDGVIIEQIEGPTNGIRGNQAVLESIASAIKQLREVHGRAGLLGIGVGVPGFIHMEKGLITDSPNLPTMKNYPMRDLLSELVEAPVILENDANAAAFGEKWMGAGKAVESSGHGHRGRVRRGAVLSSPHGADCLRWRDGLQPPHRSGHRPGTDRWQAGSAA
ncbi:MAG: ROK family protein [Bryobacterales bacterium]|nr:ROK family protein [Bryobacterales bacterium]